MYFFLTVLQARVAFICRMSVLAQFLRDKWIEILGQTCHLNARFANFGFLCRFCQSYQNPELRMIYLFNDTKPTLWFKWFLSNVENEKALLSLVCRNTRKRKSAKI